MTGHLQSDNLEFPSPPPPKPPISNRIMLVSSWSKRTNQLELLGWIPWSGSTWLRRIVESPNSQNSVSNVFHSCTGRLHFLAVIRSSWMLSSYSALLTHFRSPKMSNRRGTSSASPLVSSVPARLFLSKRILGAVVFFKSINQSACSSTTITTHTTSVRLGRRIGTRIGTWRRYLSSYPTISIG